MKAKNARRRKNQYEPIPGISSTMNDANLEETHSKFSFYNIPAASFLRSFFALLKKNFIVRRRISSSFMTIIIMPFMVLPLTELDFGMKPTLKDIRNPNPILYPNAASNISNILSKKSNSILAAAPDNDIVRRICLRINNNWNFVENRPSLVKTLYNSTIGAGFYFPNSNSIEFQTKPEIIIASKDFDDPGIDSLINAIHNSVSLESNRSVQYYLSKKYYAGKYGVFRFSSDSLITTYIMFPVISIASSEVAHYLKEKELKFVSLLLLSGCSRFLYWLSTITTAIICCLPCCLIISYYLTAESSLMESDMSLIFTLLLLFSIAVTLSTFFISCFLEKASSIRSFKLPFTFLSIFMSVISNYLRILESPIFKAITSMIVPQIPYSHGLSTIFATFRFGGPVKWDDIYSGGEFSVFNSLIHLIYSSLFYVIAIAVVTVVKETGFSIKRIIELNKSKNKNMFQGGDHVLKTYQLMKNYGQTVALNNTSFSLDQGDIVAIIGPNGSGKSTLIGVITQTVKSDSGSISLFGNIHSDSFVGFDEIKHCCGVCFQNNVLQPQLSGYEHLQLFGTIRGMTPSMLSDRISHLLSQLSIESCYDTQSENLSGGQKRKLCVAIALLAKPPLLILDEPTSGVDIQSRQVIWKALSKQKDTATLITSHALEEAESVCNKIMVVRKGEITFQGTAIELRSEFQCGYLLRIVDDPYDHEGFLNRIKEIIPEAVNIMNHKDTIILPVDKRIGFLLKELEGFKSEYGVTRYTFTIEALEEVLLRMVQDDDAIVAVDTKNNE